MELVFQRRLQVLEQRLDALLQWKNPNDTLKEVIKKVRRQQEHILTFVKHEGAPHHNNYGEYIIKKGVVKRKMSGGSMSAEGARAYACIQSVAMTCQLRGISFRTKLQLVAGGDFEEELRTLICNCQMQESIEIVSWVERVEQREAVEKVGLICNECRFHRCRKKVRVF